MVTSAPSRERSSARWTAGALPAVLAGLLAATPVIAAMVRLLDARWTPMTDNALIAVSALDSLTAEPPLLGPWSSGYTNLLGDDTFHPGPLLFWLLALPGRLLGTPAFVVTAAVVNVLAIVGCVVLARRRGGLGLMVAVAIAIPVMLASVPTAALSDIWNPSLPLLPFMLLVFVAWSLACGEHRLLPLAVLLVSFVAHCHLGFLVPAVAALAVGVAGLWLSRDRAGSGRALRRSVAIAAVVGLACWIGPLIDQATNRPGNLVLVARAATTSQETLGLDPAWRAVVHSVGVPAWWLGQPQSGLERVTDLIKPPGAATIASAALVLLGLMATTAAGVRRRRADVAAAGALALVLCAAMAVVTRSTPFDSLPTLTYSLRWASPVGMFAWLALGWSAVTLTADRRRRAPAVPRAPALGLGLAAIAAVAVVVTASARLHDEPFEAMRAVARSVQAALPEGRPVRVDVASDPDGAFLALGVGAGLLYELRRDGHPLAAPVFASYLGPEYGDPAGAGGDVLRVDVGRRPPPGGRTVARAIATQTPDPDDPLAPDARRRTIVVTLYGRESVLVARGSKTLRWR